MESIANNEKFEKRCLICYICESLINDDTVYFKGKDIDIMICEDCANSHGVCSSCLDFYPLSNMIVHEGNGEQYCLECHSRFSDD